MAKRQAGDREVRVRPSKKVKSTSDLDSGNPPTVIKHASDLAELLAFRQDEPQRLRSNIQEAITFVGSLENYDNAESKRRRTILLQYLQSVIPREGEDRSTAWADVFQTWSFASHTGHDALLSTIPSFLATVISAISQWEDFTQSGSRLCKTILRKDQFTLIERGLTTPQQKPVQAAACLRLLNEILTYDFGSLARSLYREAGRSFTLLERLLSPKLQQKASSERVAAVRSSAVAFTLANLRYQPSSVKAELIGQFRIVRNLFMAIDGDPPATVARIVKYSLNHVLRDNKLSMSVRGRFLADSTLVPLARYSRKWRRIDKADYAEASSLAREFLVDACTRTVQHPVGGLGSDFGGQSGHETLRSLAQSENVTSDSGARHAHYLLARTSALTSLLQALKPDSDLNDRSLALLIFEHHPKTQTEYFNAKQIQYFDPPKLTATWIGYATFLLSLQRSPLRQIDSSTIAESPADTLRLTTLLDYLLPIPLQRSVLERGLNQSSAMITDVTVQIIIASLHRLRQWTELQQSHPTAPKTAVQAVLDAFSQRCPRTKCVLVAYKRCKEQHLALNLDLARLLYLYCATVPQLVVEEKVDVAMIISESLQAFAQQGQSITTSELESQEINELVKIATELPDMRWWNKPDSMRLSPFTSVLRMACLDSSNAQATQLVAAILAQESILQQHGLSRAFKVLISSLASNSQYAVEDVAFEYLDHCCHHLVKQDAKYATLLYALIDRLDLRRDKEDKAFSPLALALADQWSFVMTSKPPTDVINVANWIARFIDGLDSIGENRAMLRLVRDDIANLIELPEAQTALNDVLPESKPFSQPQNYAAPSRSVTRIASPRSSQRDVTGQITELSRALDDQLLPGSEAEDHPELTRWRTKSLEDAIDDGHVRDLLLCLCSLKESVRLQAWNNVQMLKAQLANFKGSQDDRGLALSYWVLAELYESWERTDKEEALSFFVACFTAQALAIQRDARHMLFAKVNDYIDKHPCWDFAKMPGHWVRRVYSGAPDMPNLHFREVLWLLDLLHDGLRTSADVERYFATNVFEPLLAGCLPGSAPDAVWIKTMHLLYRCIMIGGGRTLVTRFGLLSWIATSLDDSSVTANVKLLLRSLALKLRQTAEEDVLMEWSGGNFGRRIDELQKGPLPP